MKKNETFKTSDKMEKCWDILRLTPHTGRVRLLVASTHSRTFLSRNTFHREMHPWRLQDIERCWRPLIAHTERYGSPPRAKLGWKNSLWGWNAKPAQKSLRGTLGRSSTHHVSTSADAFPTQVCFLAQGNRFGKECELWYRIHHPPRWRAMRF